MKCFVYGTLRQAGHNSRYVGADPDASFMVATAPGRIYHLNPYSRAYPVSKFDEEGTIIGEVHDFTDRTWQHVVAMEEGAGYELRDVLVTYEDGSSETVGAWHYKREPIGPRIESGDWFDRSFDPVYEDEDDEWDDEDVEDD